MFASIQMLMRWTLKNPATQSVTAFYAKVRTEKSGICKKEDETTTRVHGCALACR